MSDEWKLTIEKISTRISKIVERPSDKQLKDVEVEIIGNDKLKNINMHVTKIEPKYQDDILVVVYGSDFKLKDSIEIPLVPSKLIDGRTLIIGDDRFPCPDFNDILKHTASWLFKSGRIQKKDLPIYVLNGGRFLLNTTPYHSNGRRFDGSEYKPSQDVYLNTNFSAKDCRRQAEYLMEKFAPDVKFEIIEGR